MRQVISILIAVCCGISLGAQALTGSGDSAAGPLETVPPSLHAVSAATEGSLSAAFSEPMLAPGVTTPGNYAVSGLGTGTLTAHPANVSGTGPYVLSWTSGEMLDGAAVTLTAANLQDLMGNLIDPAHNSASCAGIGTAPVFSNLAATPAQAATGDTVTITFTASEELLSDPEVEVNGHAATRSGSGKAVDYTYEYTVLESDPAGMAAVAVSGFDLAGNPGAVSGNDTLEITASETAVPLYAWPAGFAFLAAGLFLLRNRKRSLGAALFVAAALLASSIAFAQAPTVSNVTFSQGPNGTTGTQVDIYYDLVAPNGPCAITVSLSKDGGADGYIHPVTSVTGDIAGVTTGTGKHIVWDIRADYPGENIPNARIRVTADDAVFQHTLTYLAGPFGHISGPTPQTVNHGVDGAQVTAVADLHYHFVQWSDLSTDNPRTDTDVTTDITVTATFAINTYDITCNVVGNGTCTANPATVNHGSTSDITFAPDTGWYLLSVVDSVEGPKCNTYTTSPVTENRTVTATFSSDRVVMLPGCVPLELVWVPSGSYQMGRYPGEVDSETREDPQHPVTLSYGFWMGKYEITQQQWLAVQGSWPGMAPSETLGLGNTYSAYNISWNDAKNFITTLNAYIISSGQGPLTVRLPSEAEWEYACRAGTQTRFYWGDDSGYTQIGDYAWYLGNISPSGSKPVGGKTANAFGWCDMSGNVWEWCEDDYHGSYTGAPADGRAWIDSPRASHRMVRGGGWNSFAGYCRSAYRYNYTSGNRDYSIGFRLTADNRTTITSFAINSGAATASNPVVTLDNTAVNGPVDYMASEASDFAGATWQPYAAAPSFTLSSGKGGVKTVYFKVRNADGESVPVSDTINLPERTILLPGSVPLVLVWVPSVSYQMGRYPGEVDSYGYEDPQHPVTLAYGFWMGKYEITQQQWLAVRSTWPGLPPGSTYGLGNNYPAYFISWDDAKNFVATLNAYIVSSGQGPLTVRLPSEAEWEYACRAGTQTRFYWGDDSGYTQIGNYAWYDGNNSPNGSKPVGGKTANAFGLYDMSGNVYEWCEDDYHSTYTGAPTDGSAWIDSPRASYRMFRGGGWIYYARYCRSASRNYNTLSVRSVYVGFRLAAVQ